MKFLLDANIPPPLAEDLTLHEVKHVNSFPLGTATSDKEIMEYSHQNNIVLVSKDTDFYDSFTISNKPKKLILMKLGNLRLREIRDYFRKNFNFVEQLLNQHSIIILTPESIKTL